MSDSLSATVIVSVRALTISANVVELEDEDDELPRLPALVDAEELEPDEDEVPELEDDVDPEDTESPGERLCNETIVPLVGARSHVCASAILALATLSSALYTDARADAMLDADDVVVVAAPLEPEAAPPEPDAPAEPPDAAVGADGVVVLGVVVAGVVVGVLGVVVVGVVVVLLGVVVVAVVGVVLGVVVVGVVVVVVVVGVVVLEGVVGEVEVEVVAVLAVVPVSLVVSDTNSVEPELAFSRLVLVDDELLSALLS